MVELITGFYYLYIVISNHDYQQSNSQEVQALSPVTMAKESSPVGEIEAYIKTEMGDTGVLLARCESSSNPHAVSYSGKYKGLFQYDDVTWSSNCDGDIYNYKDQVACTKKLIDKGEIWRWPTCRWKL